MKLHFYSDTPFLVQLSFYQIIEQLEQLAAADKGKHSERSERAKSLLKKIALRPELAEGITDDSTIEENAELIHQMLADYFPEGLTLNEIKAVSLPYRSIIFNHTKRFKNILNAAGPEFSILIRNLDIHQLYVRSCCLILNEFYGTRLDLGKPLFYDIPNADGISKHYRILYNADFLEIIPTEKSVQLSADDIELLLNNYDDLDLWREKFPKESWILKGFAIMTLFDATVENAVSILKEKLLGLNAMGFRESVEPIFRSIYLIPDIEIGFTLYDAEEDQFGSDVLGQQLKSYLLTEGNYQQPNQVLCINSYHNLMQDKKYFAVSDTEAYLAANPKSPLALHFSAQNIRSFILAPVVKNNVLLGVLEIISKESRELNSINANKLEVVMPFLTDTIERMVVEIQNQVQAIIQEKYTTIHSSVYWKFRAEARKLVYKQKAGKEYLLKEIVFPDVYPLYGQIDIKGSSEVRNLSIQKDLQTQLTALLTLLEAIDHQHMETFRKDVPELRVFLQQLSSPLRADTEQHINSFLNENIHPQLLQLKNPELIHAYFKDTEKDNGNFHFCRRKYEQTISLINEKMADILDDRQLATQNSFPHYYERFKTDGVEHNLYIGASIAPQLQFDQQKLHDLRFWQLRTLCEMEIAHQSLKPTLPYPLDVTTLVLVYNSTLAIRFRMDEKRFDVDGSYNARFEIVKKRIDKACIKNTNERISQTGKITIVYANETEEQEYIKYIQVLQMQNLLDNDIETIEVEDLQGVSGLKALLVKIVRSTN